MVVLLPRTRRNPDHKIRGAQDCGDGVVESGEGCDDGNTSWRWVQCSMSESRANYKCPTAGRTVHKNGPYVETEY